MICDRYALRGEFSMLLNKVCDECGELRCYFIVSVISYLCIWNVYEGCTVLMHSKPASITPY